MPRPAFRTPLTQRTALVAGLIGLLAVVSLSVTGTSAQAGSGAASHAARAAQNVVTPGDFTGYGFDQCLAPEQFKMNRWLNHSPFLAVGIYVSGDSRACRDQPNLTPKWIRTQLANGWRLLPITLGPQASCQPRFPRYGDDVKINPRPGNHGHYSSARTMGSAEAIKSVSDAKALGIVEGSTLWYDLEGFDYSNTDCRESALAFLSAWTHQLHKLNYISGVYSSAGSGILMLDNARVNRPTAFVLPDQIWIARWDGNANTSTSYIREDGWRPHNRVKQYQGGHDETWGNVRINIDRNFLDVGRGSVAAPESHCDGTPISFLTYDVLRPPVGDQVASPMKVKALQCLLKEQNLYAGRIHGRYTNRVVVAVNSWQTDHGFPAKATWSRKNWMSLLVAGAHPVLKFGSAGPDVRRVQRALNAADPKAQLVARGVFDARTAFVLRTWQAKAGREVSGVVAPETWAGLAAGIR